MSGEIKEVIHKDNIVQAVIIADNFADEFAPLSNDIPLSLFPLLNKPLLDYTLEFLSLGGVEETYLFCCSHVDLIRKYVKKRLEESACWSLNMKVHIIISECCRSFGDCLRDLDAKGLLRGDFILLEPGVVSNIKLLPILKKHKEITKQDKGAAITLVYQECGVGQNGRTCEDESIVAINSKNRILYHKKMKKREKKIVFPVEIFLENSEVSILHNLKDTHIAICSSSVPPLFSDNFDFQTKDDFVRGLLMNEEIMGSTTYLHVVKGNQYGGAAVNWRSYQTISWEAKNGWIYPLISRPKENRFVRENIVGKTVIPEKSSISRCIIGDNVSLGQDIVLEDCFIMSNSIISDNVRIILSVIGPNCRIGRGCKILNSTVLGKGVEIDKDKQIENELIQATKPEFCEKEDILGEKAFRLNLDEEEDEDLETQKIPRLFSHLNSSVTEQECDEDDGFSDSDDEELSHTHSPILDDTKSFFNEVIDSLTRGFEDELQCDNLILEINSSRYAYNVTLEEVNFNVIKAILHMYLRQPIGPRYFSQLLSYFSPILKNYICNESAMSDCLQAIEDVTITNEEVKENWVLFVLKWFYNADYLSEEAILEWGRALDPKAKFTAKIKPFLEWLEQAEEASSSEDE